MQEVFVFNYLFMNRYSIIYQEQSNGLEIVQWIQDQIWSNGKVIFNYFIYLYKYYLDCYLWKIMGWI